MKDKVIWASLFALLVSFVVLLSLPWSDRVQHRVVCASPTLLNGRRWVMDVHQHNPKQESVIKASLQAELLSSGIFWPTFTVSIMKNPWCSRLSAANEELTPLWLQTPVISGQFGSFAGGSKLHLAVPLGVDLSGHDLCVVITNNRAENSNSIALENAAKANIIVHYDVVRRQKNMLGVIAHNKLMATFFTLFTSSILVLFGRVAMITFPSIINNNPSVKSLRAHVFDRIKHDGSKKKSAWRRRQQRQRSTMHSNLQMEEHSLSDTAVDSKTDTIAKGTTFDETSMTDQLDVVAADLAIGYGSNKLSVAINGPSAVGFPSVSSMNSGTEMMTSRITTHMNECENGDHETVDSRGDMGQRCSSNHASNEEQDVKFESDTTSATESTEENARTSDADYEIIPST